MTEEEDCVSGDPHVHQGINIDIMKEYKYLGVWVDNILYCAKHTYVVTILLSGVCSELVSAGATD